MTTSRPGDDPDGRSLRARAPVVEPSSIQALIDAGLVVVGEGVIIEHGVELCHPTRAGLQLPVHVGPGCWLRSGTVIYSGVRLAEGVQTGHHVMVRENAVVDRESVLGTGAVCEFGTRIGAHVLVETHAYVTANMLVEDYVFIGPGVVTTNDRRMLWRRAGANQFLVGPVLRWGCRVGAGAVLLPGVEIGRRAVVGAGAVVVEAVPERGLVLGNPARLVRVLDDDSEPVVTS
jgi:acetyltransferase-like isoleucine patch superfamily enzyme